jgi:UDP-N-acetyl-D-galactosamine dehydrogenase
MTQNQTIPPTIAIVGLGYVGLPLALAFAKLYNVIGFDINETRIRDLQNGEDHTLECTEAEIKNAKHLTFTCSLNAIKEATIFIVTVPTPVDTDKRPNLKPLVEATTMIGSVLKEGDLVIYESTVSPGCTDEDCVPVLEKQSSLVFNKDFYVGYSPERINPGDKVHTLITIKKLTAGSTPEIADKVDVLYASIIKAGTFKVSSIKVAEAAKSIENAQRDINISFVNELALIFDRMGIDTHEVLEAAATKWNFLPFKPGLVGGHCIGVDPYYLAYKATSLGYHPQVILSGRNVNDQMGTFVTEKLMQLLTVSGIATKGAKALILGVSFKENCPDIRNTRVVDIYWELNNFDFDVDIYDPWASASDVMHEYGISILSESPDITIQKYSAIVFAVGHEIFKSIELKSSNDLVIYDVKGILPKEYVDARL